MIEHVDSQMHLICLVDIKSLLYCFIGECPLGGETSACYPSLIRLDISVDRIWKSFGIVNPHDEYVRTRTAPIFFGRKTDHS